MNIKYESDVTANLYELSAGQTEVASIYPYRVSPYYAGLIRSNGDAIWKQCIPDAREMDDSLLQDDPLAESSLSPVPGIIHRYPDRVVLLVSNRCAVYCRFCMRKRHIGHETYPELTGESLERALNYIADHPEIHDVLLSGGDPLMLDDTSLSYILGRIKSIGHVSYIRIGTRIPVTLPARVTEKLCNMLKSFAPVYVNLHFNHPSEITAESAAACSLLADAGVPLGNQTVLLRGVNDSVEVMKELFQRLLAIRVRPYYLHHMDLVKGTEHFRTSVSCGLEIIKWLRGHISGMAIPHYVIDLPGGKGKVPVLPDSVIREGDELVLTTWQGEKIRYPDPLP